jgi:thiamine-phosphate pyrophosphorylase
MSRNPQPLPQQSVETATLRLIDASINRATEGLRVIEDYVRFVLDDAHLTAIAKNIRHDLTSLCLHWPTAELHAARETRQDVGTHITTDSEISREDVWSVCSASIQRVKQSLRSLEEFAKLDPPERACSSRPTTIEAIRYRVYTLERCITIATISRDRLGPIRLCVLTDGLADADTFARLVDQLLAAGVRMIQLRDKRLPDNQLIDRGNRLVKLTRNHQALAIINDRPDMAVAVQADGVHLGQDDLSVKDARAILGPRRLIGLSTHSIEQARKGVLDGADYLGVGPTFPSTTKSFDHYPGLGLLRQVAAEMSIPAFAIGGINVASAANVLTTGIDRIAVSQAVASAPDPAAAANILLSILAPKGTSADDSQP